MCGMDPAPNCSGSLHPGSTGPKQGVVAVLVAGDRLLMIQRSLTVRAPGMFCFPGGTIEPGESQFQALQRELVEELGLHIEPKHQLWNCVTDWGTELAWWLVESGPRPAPIPNPAEVAWCGWMTIGEILAEPNLLTSNRRFFERYFCGDFSLPISG